MTGAILLGAAGTQPSWLLTSAAEGRIVVGMVLVAASLAKLTWSGGSFSESGGWVERVGELAQRALAPIELIVGMALVIGIAPSITSGAALLLLVSFTLYLFFRIIRGNTKPCHCFGDFLSRTSPSEGIVRNLCLMGLAAVSALEPAQPLQLRTHSVDAALYIPAIMLASVVLATYALLVRAIGLESRR